MGSTKPTAPPPGKLMPRRHYLCDVRIFLAYDRNQYLTGVLVTGHHPQFEHPIAFLPADPTDAGDAERVRLLDRASEILRDESTIDAGCWLCVDLRDRGRVDSTRPMPGFLYGVHLRPVVDGDAIEGGRDYPYRPYCPVRLAWMVAEHMSRHALVIGQHAANPWGVGVFADVEPGEPGKSFPAVRGAIAAYPVAHDGEAHDEFYEDVNEDNDGNL